ncbi:salicyl-AMP ligase [Mycobacterium vulneris]|uniref:Salicyl-AMP ligase n=1 Tax=Mycolicibacterium vulneris TaxID=547163 RepID=A0A1X2L3G7_9MYCO|nr:AMP-binding protein [Mycolicibacterium vulneris]OSC28467.1 salicyl-AMP ligase [Mycolicibacterium vulneris]
MGQRTGFAMIGIEDADVADKVTPYPDSLAARYRAAGFWRPRTLCQELQESVERFSDRLAVVDPGVSMTYAELGDLTDRIATGLLQAGLKPGERVLFQTTNHIWAVLGWYGVLKAGLVPVATLAQHRWHEISAIAGQCAPAAHLYEPGFTGHDLRSLATEIAHAQPSLRIKLTVGTTAPASDELSIESLAEANESTGQQRRLTIEQVQRQLSPESLAVLQLSGGTTSVPKLIPRLSTEYWYNAAQWGDATNMDSTSVAVHLLPLIHNAGIVCALHAAHSVGACFATSPPDTAAFLRLASTVTITHMLMTRPIARVIEADSRLRAALAGLRTVAWADRSVPSAVVDEYETGACKVIQMFGMGEGMCMFSPRDASAEIRHGTQGTPISPGDEVRVLDPGSERQVPPGTSGELCARGPYTIRGYFAAPERNAEAFTSDGFYRTGDIVTEILDGAKSYYRLEDRIKDLINRGGEKINAEEVELLLLRHEGIERAALVAMPDSRLGERACAFVVLRQGSEAIELETIKQFLSDQGVAKFKWPERLEIRTELPLTNIHKVNKAILREEIATLLADEG